MNTMLGRISLLFWFSILLSPVLAQQKNAHQQFERYHRLMVDAQRQLQQTIAILVSKKDTDTISVVEMLSLASIYLQMEKTTTASPLLRAAEKNRQLSVFERALLHMLRGHQHYTLGAYDEAIAQLKLARELSEGNRLEGLTGRILNWQGSIEIVRYQYDAALVTLKKAFEISQKLSEPLLEIDVNRGLSFLYYRLDDMNQSLRFDNLALNLAAENDYSLIQIDVLFNIAMYTYKEEQFQQSIKLFERLKQVALQIGSEENIAYAEFGLARNYLRLDQISKAVENIARAIDMAHTINNAFYQVEIYSAGAEIYSRNDQLEQASIVLEQANIVLERKRPHLDLKLVHILNTNLIKGQALILTRQHKYKEANQYLIKELENIPYDNQELFSQATQKLKHDFDIEREKFKTQLLEQKNQQTAQQLALSQKQKQMQQVYLAAFSIIIVLLMLLSFFLYKTKKQIADEASYKASFMANMSHELRTPLNSILGLADLLSEDALNKAAKDKVDKIRASCQTLLGIITDLLDISKMESGHFILSCSDFNLRKTLVPIENVLETADENNPNLKTLLVFDSEIPEMVYGDELRLQQILLNLTSNAIKFTARGQVKVALNMGETFDGGFFLLVTVTDEGIGMTAEQVEHIFEAYKQANENISRQYGGTGLGLYICAQLIHAMGGHIHVSSEVNVGSKFTLKLPLSLAKHQEQPAKLSNINHECLAEKEVLIVEDNAVNQMVLTKLLQQKSVKVTTANHGQEALEHLKQNIFDIVVMDIQMPVMDGFAATKKIREQYSAEQLPIIALTANTFNDEKERCLKVGMNDFLTKPVTAKLLYDMLAIWLTNRS